MWGDNLKMFEDISDEVRLKALLKIVRSFIVNSRNAEIFRLEEVMKEKISKAAKTPSPISEKEIKEKRKEKIKEEVKAHYEKPAKDKISDEDFKESLFNPQNLKSRPIPLRAPPQFNARGNLNFPRVPLPRHLSSVKPVASKKVVIDLGKLNPFFKDPKVSSVETEGENQTVYVSGSMGRKPTGVRLSKKEIEEVIRRFSEKSKIPINEGLFKVAVGDLLLTATISDSVSSRFILEKIEDKN